MIDEINDSPDAHYVHIEDMLIQNLAIFPDYLYEVDLDQSLFLNPNFALAFTAITSLRAEGAPITAETLSFKYNSMSRVEDSNLPFAFEDLWKYRSQTISPHMDYWVKQLKDRALKLSYANELLKNSMLDMPIEEKANKLIQNIGDLVDKYAPKSIYTFENDWVNVLNIAENAKEGNFPHSLKTFYPKLDDIIESGIEDDYLCVLAAYSGTGKTSLALNFAKNISMNLKHTCAYLSLEMGRERLMRWYISACTSIPMNSFRNGQITHEQLGIAANVRANNLPPNAFDIIRSSGDIDNILSIFKIYIQKRPECRLITIDHLNLMTYGKSSNAVEKQSIITGKLKDFVNKYQIPILLLAQFKKPSDTAFKKEADKIPSVHNILGSTSVMCDADLVMLAQTAPGFESMLPKRMIQVFIGKNRGGEASNNFANLLALGDSAAIVEPTTHKVFNPNLM